MYKNQRKTENEQKPQENYRILKVWGLVLGRVGGVLKLSWPVLGVSCRLLGAILGGVGDVFCGLEREDGHDRNSIRKDEGLKVKMCKNFKQLYVFEGFGGSS